MTDETTTLEAEVVEEDAAREIAKAVTARHSLARKYVMRLRRRRPDATPAELIRMLERHYGTSISTAGAVITAGTIAADIGIGLIPGVGAAAAGVKSASQQAAKKAGKEAVKAATKVAAQSAAKSGAKRAAALIPAGEEQLQFEITALFGLAIADIHGMKLDQDQAQALVYGLTNDRVSQKQIATMAADVAKISGETAGDEAAIASADRTQWATTLADALPAGAAQSLVRTMQTGQLDTVRANLSGKQQSAIDYGTGALAGGVSRFVFGREVVNAARVAFGAAPDIFPPHLDIATETISDASDSDSDGEQNRALAALEDAAKTTGTWITDTAGTVGGGVASAAGTVARSFRSVDIDGDGIPDEPQALTAVKGVGGAIAGAADAVGGGVAKLFKSKKRS